MSKAAIYKEYGIEYKAGKILSPIGWISELMIDGNSKIGKGVFHFSTLPGTKKFTANINGKDYQVKGTCICDCVGCYAMTGNYRFQSTINALAVRTIIAREYTDFCKRAILAQIKANDIKTVRIHASGDFFNFEYTAMWIEIVNACKDTLFWTYTKNKNAENAFSSFDNANIVKSVIPGIGLNFGHCDYIKSTFDKLKADNKSVYICRCGVDKNQHCTNCKGCATHDYVLFIEHSTSYKAAADPAFNELKNIIENQ